MKYLLKRCVPVIAIFAIVILLGSTAVKANPGPVLNVVTSAVTTIDKTTATFNGSVNYTDGTPILVERGFEYGVDTNYGSTAIADGDVAVGNFDASISGLSCNTTYHVRAYTRYTIVSYLKPRSLLAFFVNVAYATPPNPYAYGSDVTFTTGSCTRNFNSSRSSHHSTSTEKTTTSITPQTTGNVTQTSVITTTNTPPAATPTFDRDLKVGSQGDDVKRLQQYLNGKGFIIAATGSGSVGNETTYFGPATKAALIQFQTAKGITPASGYFGPLTRAYIASH